MNLTYTKAMNWLLLIPIAIAVGCTSPAKTTFKKDLPEILTLESHPEIGAESVFLTQDLQDQPVAV